MLPVIPYNPELELIILIDRRMKENNLPEQLPVKDWNAFIDPGTAPPVDFTIPILLDLIFQILN